MPESVRIAKIDRPGGGRLHVRFAGKTGVMFNGAADATAVLAGVRAAITNEALTVLALNKIGPANAELLEGKTITLMFDVVIA